MTEEIDTGPDAEPEESADGIEPPVKKGTSGRRRSFDNLRRELSDDELASPATQRMLLDEIERLDADNDDLRVFREKFHAADRKVGVMEERFKTRISMEVVHIACVTVNGEAAGFGASNWTVQPSATLAVVFGGVLILAGVIAKAVKP